MTAGLQNEANVCERRESELTDIFFFQPAAAAAAALVCCSWPRGMLGTLVSLLGETFASPSA